MGLFQKLFGKDDRGPRKDGRLGSSKERKALFADNAYLTRTEKPEALIIIPMKDVIHAAMDDKLMEENATVLKQLHNDYNLKIIITTGYEAPNAPWPAKHVKSKTIIEAEKAEMKAQNAHLMAAGVSEIYYSNFQKFNVTDKGLVKDQWPKIKGGFSWKEELAIAVAQENELSKEKTIILAKDFFARESLEREGFSVVSEVEHLPLAVASKLQKKQP